MLLYLADLPSDVIMKSYHSALINKQPKTSAEIDTQICIPFLPAASSVPVQGED